MLLITKKIFTKESTRLDFNNNVHAMLKKNLAHASYYILWYNVIEI